MTEETLKFDEKTKFSQVIVNLLLTEYYFELEWKDRIFASLSLPINSNIIIIGAIAYLIREFPWIIPTTELERHLSMLSLILIIISGTYLLISIVYLIRCSFGYEYGLLVDSQSLLLSLIELRHDIGSFYKAIDPHSVESQFTHGLVTQIADLNKRNRTLNKYRSETRRRAILFASVSLAFLVLSFAPYGVILIK